MLWACRVLAGTSSNHACFPSPKATTKRSGNAVNREVSCLVHDGSCAWGEGWELRCPALPLPLDSLRQFSPTMIRYGTGTSSVFCTYVTGLDWTDQQGEAPKALHCPPHPWIYEDADIDAVNNTRCLALWCLVTWSFCPGRVSLSPPPFPFSPDAQHQLSSRLSVSALQGQPTHITS